MQIAILAWGSLIPDPRELGIVGTWEPDGPNLPIEYARISGVQSNQRRLTLVIKPGFPSAQVLYAQSSFESLQDARENLRLREGSENIDRIGFINFIDGTNLIGRIENEIVEELTRWNENKGFDSIIWTDLPPNFFDVSRMNFTLENVKTFLTQLSPNEKEAAKNYVLSTPPQIKTRFRQSIENFLDQY